MTIPRQCPVCSTWFDVKQDGAHHISTQKACPNCGVVQLVKFPKEEEKETVEFVNIYDGRPMAQEDAEDNPLVAKVKND